MYLSAIMRALHPSREHTGVRKEYAIYDRVLSSQVIRVRSWTDFCWVLDR